MNSEFQWVSDWYSITHFLKSPKYILAMIIYFALKYHTVKPLIKIKFVIDNTAMYSKTP